MKKYKPLTFIDDTGDLYPVSEEIGDKPDILLSTVGGVVFTLLAFIIMLGCLIIFGGPAV